MERAKLIFLYGEEHLSLDEMLGREDILKFLRRGGQDLTISTLRKRLCKGLRNASITKEVVTEYAHRPKPVPAPRAKPIPAPRTRPVPIPRKITSKLRPTPPPRTRNVKPVPPPRTRNVKPVPPPRTRNVKPASPPRTEDVRPVPPPRTKDVKPVPPLKECEHGDTEEISGSIFCIHCGLEVDHAPYRYMPTYGEPQGFDHMRKGHIFKRRTRPKAAPKEKYIPVSPSEVPLLGRKEKDKEIKDQILGYLGLLDEN